MECKDIADKELIAEYALGRLGPEESKELSAHISVCAECASELELVRAVRDERVELPQGPEWSGLAKRVVREARVGKRPGFVEWLGLGGFWQRALVPVAATVAVVIGLVFFGGRGGVVTTVDTHLDPAYEYAFANDVFPEDSLTDDDLEDLGSVDYGQGVGESIYTELEGLEAEELDIVINGLGPAGSSLDPRPGTYS